MNISSIKSLILSCLMLLCLKANAGVPNLPLPKIDRCPTTCKNDVQIVTEGFTDITGKFSCFYKMTASCAPYSCLNGYECRVTCVTDVDCTSGYGCDQNNKCAPKVYSCADRSTVISYDGTLSNCSPYNCLSGQCKSFCGSPSDCSSDAHCVSQRCVPNL